MPIVELSGTDLSYYLIAFDPQGAERPEESGDQAGERLSQRLAGLIADQPVTDVFFMSHGWRADVPAARGHYDRWIRAMADCGEDRRRVRAARPDFQPLLIGLHWPSEPFGDEGLSGSGGGFAAGGAVGTPADWIEGYVERLADSPEAQAETRAALQTIVDAFQQDPTPTSLPPEVVGAYDAVNRAAGLGSSGPGGSPAEDREPFDAEAIYQAAQGDDPIGGNYGQSALGRVFFEPLRALSFWRMKERGCKIGESGGNQLLVSLLQAAGTRDVRFHLMGHSFGCIVVSATVAGPNDEARLPRPINSLVLVQGAMSHWSYCSSIPEVPDRHGYFRRIVDQARVAGPILTTRSRYDTAVSTYYPKAARGRELAPFGPGAQDQVSYEPGAPPPPPPKYGGVGTFGLRGPGLEIEDLPLKSQTDPYFFESGRVYNLECSDVINAMEGSSGAHSDIAHPEVAHAVWEAAWGSEQRLAFNGVNCSTGAYLLPPLTPAQVSSLARGERIDGEHLNDLKYRAQESEAHFGVRAGVDRRDLAQTGWGVIFAHDADPAVYDALRELLEHRHEQAGDLYREYRGPKGYFPNKTKNRFLVENGSGPGPVDPAKMPYYLLIVGDPESIPFGFQYQLDVQFAVGRIHFDTVDEYARYAHAVVAAETNDLALPRRAAFFGAQNPADEATSLSANHLVSPLAAWLTRTLPDWEVDLALKDDAKKARLSGLLGGDQTPALLFTATHGAVFERADARQLQHQGALLCQDWPGPFGQAAGTPISADHYFSRDDVGDDARLHGLLSFHFACYGAGTPRYDDYAHQRAGATERAEIAPNAFVGALPKRLLGHPKGGALAVVGHVERAWGCSFLWGGRTREQTTTFESTLTNLLNGYPVGAALEDFNERYAELSTDLTDQLEQIKYGRIANDLELSSLWTANNDARGYAIVGDPAVRLCVAGAGADASERQALTTTPTVAGPSAAAATAPTGPAPATDGAAGIEAGAAPSVAPAAPPVASPSVPAEATVTGPAPSVAPASPAAPVPYGLLDPVGLGEAQARLADAVRQLADRVGQALAQVAGEAATVSVTTYLSDDLGRAQAGTGGMGVDAPQAVTRIGADGGLEVFLPSEPGQRDPAVWQLHLDMVQRAQAHRAELLRVTIEASGALLAPYKTG
jgi:hypothetical protein